MAHYVTIEFNSSVELDEDLAFLITGWEFLKTSIQKRIIKELKDMMEEQ